ncbi:MAG: MurR/RpiR family transcriptional regulator [Lawsonibacter sp.]|nr:MurR/RpiR family transcriptional regulator [Lawsonibacter sp.]
MAGFTSKVSEKMDSLTRSQKNVASYFLYHLDKVAFGTVHDLAAQIGVSTTTIVRFAQEMGYAGFAELQRDAQDSLWDMRPNLNKENPQQLTIPEAPLIAQTFQDDMLNLEKTFQSIDVEKVEQAAKILNSSRNIYVLGMRVCRSLSTCAFIHWGQGRPNVRLIHNDSLAFPEEVADIQEGDALFAFWISRYNRTTRTILQYCRKKKAKVVLISDMGAIPEEELCDIRIPCYVQTSSYMHSLVAPMTVINYLTRAIEGQYSVKAAKRLSQMDELLGSGFFLV